MLIPLHWTKVNGETKRPDGQKFSVFVWGWGTNAAEAERKGKERLQRVLDRLKRGEPFPDQYDYGSLPIREQIVQSLQHEGDESPCAVVTRNRYGALVLNTPRVLFLDIDVKPQGFLRKLFGANAADDALKALKEALQKTSATFRIYRTAAGFRAIAIDKEYDPASEQTQALMRATNTDPAFARLCKVQRSFRARLTPKPWRCDTSLPPAQYPFESGPQERAFADWLREYDSRSERHSTCHFLEKIGQGEAGNHIREVIELHDRMSRCKPALPLA